MAMRRSVMGGRWGWPLLDEENLPVLQNAFAERILRRACSCSTSDDVDARPPKPAEASPFSGEEDGERWKLTPLQNWVWIRIGKPRGKSDGEGILSMNGSLFSAHLLPVRQKLLQSHVCQRMLHELLKNGIRHRADMAS